MKTNIEQCDSKAHIHHARPWDTLKYVQQPCTLFKDNIFVPCFVPVSTGYTGMKKDVFAGLPNNFGFL